MLVVGFAAPGFAVGIVLLYVFGVALGWFPVYGAGNGFLGRIYHLTLPAVAFSIFLTAIVGRQTRAATLDVMERDYIAFARARGLSEHRILTRYALRNVAVPVVNAIGVVVIVAVSGALFIEEVFSLQGDGYLMYQSVTSRDIPVVQGLAILVAVLVVIVNLGVDALHFGGRRAHALSGEVRPVSATFELNDSAASPRLRRRRRPPALTTGALWVPRARGPLPNAGPLIAPQDPDKQNLLLGAVPPSSADLLGTDQGS